jgi:hypothetical protein
MKILAKQGFLLLTLLVAISYSFEPPDLVEELDGMSDSPFTKYSTKKAGDDDGDDTMAEDSSSNAEEDKEMMETTDTSHVRFDTISYPEPAIFGEESKALG